jgi:hypothetical protein
MEMKKKTMLPVLPGPEAKPPYSRRSRDFTK